MKISRLLLPLLVSFSMFSAKDTALSMEPNFKNTCLDIRVKFPNGIAKSKKALGIRKFPKASVNASLYLENSQLDRFGNNNGIVCDKQEKFKTITAAAWTTMNVDGVEVQTTVACDLSNPQIDNGYKVGFSNIRYDYECTFVASNHDKVYATKFSVYPKIYVVFEDQATDDFSLSSGRAFFGTERQSLSFDIRRKSSWSISFAGTSWIGGTKSEIDFLYQRIQNGLTPDLFVGLYLGDFYGCFTRTQSPPWEGVVVSGNADCMSGKTIGNNGNQVREIPDWDAN